MKKQLGFLFVILLIAAMAYGVMSTGAWFTDTAAIDNNSIQTSNLDLEVWGGPFVATALEPGAGYQSLGTFCAKNAGGYDMKWRGWIDSVNDSKGLRNYLQVKAVLNPNDSGNYGPKGEPLFADVPFTDLTQANTWLVMDDPTWAFAPGHYACYDVQARVLDTAPNAVQNATLTARLYIEATQRINTGWTQ